MRFIAIILLSFFSLSSAIAASEEAVIGVGASSRVSMPGAASIHVSNGRVLKAEDLGSTIRLTGRKPGVAVVSTDRKTLLVHVLEPVTWKLYEQLQTLLADKKGIELVVRDGFPQITGKLLRIDDWLEISTLAKDGGTYVFNANPDVAIETEARALIAKLIADAGLPQPDLQLSPAVVRLSSERADLALRFEKLLKPFGFTIEKSSGSVTLEPLVRVQILVTEIRKKMMRRLGVSWPGSAKAQLLPKFGVSGEDGPALSVQLDALEESGAGRILASPSLLSRSGKEAQFLAGGEFPIRLGAKKSQAVIWKQYGVLLKIKPVADFSGRMSIALTTEVSTIDSSRTVEGVPGLLTNRIESHFDMKGSRTIALSGLIKNESGRSQNGLPGLSSIPILDLLFSSQEFRDEQTELVVFVTPEIVTDPGAEQ